LNTLVRQFDLTPERLASAMRQRLVWIALCVVASTAIFAAVAFLSTPVYRASVIAAPANVDRRGGSGSSLLDQLGGVASLAGISLDSRDSETEEAIAVLQSRSFLEAFIADHNLLPELFASKWDAQRKQWKTPKAPTPARGVRFFREKVLSLDKDKKTGLVTVSVDWTNRQEAAEWANDLVARVNSEMRSRAIEMSRAYTAYLEKEREGSAFVETRATINKLIEAQIRQSMIASVSREYAFRVVDHALPADADDFIRPRRAMLLVIGPVAGLLLAFLVVVLTVPDRAIATHTRSP
jgi:uncharacterized protein involved in exopolysaccharide biosynthesis